MAKTINPKAIPGAGNAKTIKLEKVLLKNVLFDENDPEDIEVEVVPFNRRDDKHVEFVYAYFDMRFNAPSVFRSVSDAAREYVRMFMVHTKDDELKKDSAFSKVYGDLRACRTLLHQESTMQTFNDFFENA